MRKTIEMGKRPELNYESFLANAMRDYLDYLDALGFSTVMPVHYLRRIDRFLVEHRVRHLEQLHTQLMIQFVDKHRGQVRAQTLRLWKHTFHGLCRYLIRLGWMTENPAAGSPVPKAQPYRPHVFSPRELRLFFDFLKGQMKQAANPADRFRALSRHTFYHLLYACGLRVSEATALDRFQAGFLLEFLSHLEKELGNTASTRNSRLAALKSFFKMVSLVELRHQTQCRQILMIPAKRARRWPFEYLEKNEADALFASVNTHTHDGYRFRRHGCILRACPRRFNGPGSCECPPRK